MEEQISGLKQFFRYVLPCLENLLLERKICQDDFDYAILLMRKNHEPELAFLEKCFKIPVKCYKEYCAERKISPDFSYESVSDFWQNHHGHDGDCAVKIGTVISVTFITSSVLVECGKENIYTPNIFNLDIKKNDKVTIHKKILIQKIEQ